MGSKRDDDDDVDADDDSTGKHRLRRLLPRPVQCFHWLLVIVILALFFGAYGAVFGAFRASGSSPSSANFVGLPSQTGFTAWQLKVLSQTYGYSAQLQFTPISFPAGFTSPDGRLISNSIGVSINGVQYSFAAGTLPGIITQDIGYDTGDSQDYPFDSYSAQLKMYVWANDPSTSNAMGLIVNATEITINAQRYTFSQLDLGPGLVRLELHVNRTSIGQIYPVFLIVAFWIITLALGALGLAIIVHEYRRVEAGIILLFSGALFAMPALRNTAPLSPPFGCTLDYSSFFWCMLTCVLGFTAAAIRYVMQGRYPAFPLKAILPSQNNEMM